MGYVMAFDRLIPIPRETAGLDLYALVTAAEATTAGAVVDHFVRVRSSAFPSGTPPARCSSSGCGRTWEATACRRRARGWKERCARCSISC